MHKSKRAIGSRTAARPASEKSQAILTDLLACLRALQVHYYTAHWQAKGDPYYADHILFERMYDALPDEFDTLAEKCVAYFGGGCVEAVAQVSRMALFLEHWDGGEGLYERSLNAEEDLQVLLEAAYHIVDEKGEMSLGLDDYLMALANAHETNIYLLQQRLR